jgi:hypothetical protein
MTTKNETAEAILIVIRKIIKWILFAALCLATAVAALIYYKHYKDEEDRKVKKIREDKVLIMTHDVGIECKPSHPYAYAVINNSDWEVKKVDFSVEIRRRGFSSPLNSYTSIDEDKILKPGEGYARCFRAQSKDYRGQLTEKDVEIIITYKSVTFAE